MTHSTGADNGDQGDAGLDGAGEYWTVTTGDGTKYVFGLNKLPGAADQRTNSVWTVPVFGNDYGEPGYDEGTSFSGRALNQAWRWNLDYVVDTHGNASTYWYTAGDELLRQERRHHRHRPIHTRRSPRQDPLRAAHGHPVHHQRVGRSRLHLRRAVHDRLLITDGGQRADHWPDVPFDVDLRGATPTATPSHRHSSRVSA